LFAIFRNLANVKYLIVKLVQITDCHLFADKNKCGYNQINPFRSLQLLLNQAKLINPDRLIVTGDISGDGSEQSYQHFIRLIDDVGMLGKLHTIPGNHDDAKCYERWLGEYDLSFQDSITLANWQVHGVNTMHKGTLGKISQQDLNRLTASVEQFPTQNHLVCCHHHPIDCGSWMDKHQWLNKQMFTQMIERHDNIKLVLYGHIHTTSDIRIDHCRYLSAPSSCWQWANSKDFGLANECPGLRIVELLQDGNFNTSIRRLEESSY